MKLDKGMKENVLIAGVGGASLGTEIFKSLKRSGNYSVVGADISPYAYKKRDVSTGVHHMPLTLYPLYQRYDTDIPVAKRIWQVFVTLPLFPELSDEQIKYVILCIKEFDCQIN